MNLADATPFVPPLALPSADSLDSRLPSPPANVPNPQAPALRQAWQQARAQHPHARHRDVAASQGVSEAELIDAHTDQAFGADPRAPGLRALRLRPAWQGILAGLQGVGEVMALTRNASCVHEKVGRYEDVGSLGAPGAPVGLVLGADIDLRLFWRRWAAGWWVEEGFGPSREPQRSLQFFDAQGHAVHKVFARPHTDHAAWAELGDTFTAAEAVAFTPAPAAPPERERDDAAVDVAAFRSDWAAMRDTHEFFGLLQRHGLRRTQALRLAEPQFAQMVEPSCAREVLHRAARGAVSLMCFVGNPGVIQIHSGPIDRVAVMGPWLNVLDAGFNLHLREDHIAQAWAVAKPTADGLVSSLELFDAQGETIAMFFGARKPGQPELCAWRCLLAQQVADPAWSRHVDEACSC
jgi:putative hemin transport protein